MEIRISTYVLAFLMSFLELSSSFVHKCTFSEPGICGFKQSKADLIDWTKQTSLAQLVLPAGQSLPTRPTGTHLCACYREEQPRERLKYVNAIIDSPVYQVSSTSQARLVVFVNIKLRDQSALYIRKMEIRNGKAFTGRLIWSGNGITFGTGWKKINVEFAAQNSFKIVIEAVVTAIEYNSVRIDEYNIIMHNGGHIHPNPGRPTPPSNPRIPYIPPPKPPVVPARPKPKPTKKPRAPAPKTLAPAPAPPRGTSKPHIPRVPGRDFPQPTTSFDWNRPKHTEDPLKDRDIQSTQLTTVVLYDGVPTFVQSLPLVAVSIGLGLFLVFLVVAVAWVIRCISRVNTHEYVQKKAMMLQHQSDSMRLATSKERRRSSTMSNKSKRSISSVCISPATPDDSPLPSPAPSSPSPSTTSECSAFPGFTPTPSEMQYQWLPMHRYEDIIDGDRNKREKQTNGTSEDVYINAPLNNRSAKDRPLLTIAEELEAQFRKQGVTLFKKHQNQNVNKHEYVNKNAAINQNTYVCRSETDWVENSIYETGSVANNTKNYELIYRMPNL